MCKQVQGLNEILASEIAHAGVLPFARFMELALYCPLYGYYEAQKQTIGRRGDYFTSVSVGSLFGELLAFQFARWLETGAGPQPQIQRIIEAGAHDGQLALDILAWLRAHRPKLFDRLEYVILEPSARRQEWQRETLAEFGPRVRWLFQFPTSNPEALPSISPGVIFANEMLDAFPVRRFGWDARQKKWFEWGVTLATGKFVWAKIPDPDVVPQTPTPDLLEMLPEGFTTELCPAAEQWWQSAAHTLKHGQLLTFDYGLTAMDFFTPERRDGTLRAYHRHQLRSDLLAHPGEQDLTEHVNFTAIQAAGEAAGLKTETSATQAKFLTQITEQIWQNPSAFGEWTPGRTRQFQTLTHPQHLGRPFRVLVQNRSSL